MSQNRTAPALALLLAVSLAQADTPTLPSLPDPLAGRALPGAERLVWNRLPLRITLPTGGERLVNFGVPVRVGLPPELGTDALRTQILGGTIYWTALKPFPASRVQVQAVGSGNIYLIDLAAAQGGSAAPVEVAVPEDPAPSAPQAGTAPPGLPGLPGGVPVPEPPRPKEQDYATLVRLAAQHLYGPARLRRLPEGVHPAPAPRSGADRRLVRGGAVDATPLVAWRSGGLHVTAVRLRNATGGSLDLDPRRLRGRWLAAAFQHPHLAGRGDLRDTTAAYLISTQPYEEALNGG